jgi:hypothetical protein
VPNRAGLIVGVVPCGGSRRSARLSIRVELAILTHLPLTGASGAEPLSRNHINVLSSNVLIALPGGAGTASEVELALRYRRPIAAYLSARSEIPQLPDAVPVFGALADVQDFVRRTLRAA